MVHTWNERAHTALKGKTGMLLIWSFACSVLLEIGLMVDPTYYGLAIESVALTVLSLGGILFYIVLYPVIVGYNWLILETVRGQTVRLSDVFAPFRHRYGKHLLATLLIMLFQVLWTLLLVVPGIVKYFSYAFTYFILRDEPDLSITEAITKSRDLMRGQKWDAFKLILPFIPMYLVGWIFYIRLDLVVLGSWIFLVATSLIRPFIISRFAIMYEDARRAYDEQWNRSA
ncbi:DUF975 family protein [Exiguobacterium sp. SH3S2]|uniref:DUF975 family protein n=1 Tax=unclassified Exiguobacterium TaxID=2644629 RepID=UPI00103C9B32|nr:MULTISPECIES: DUF975 family protein [unclassified Exiguobacterium]TCI26348.1 DUF975 family protein [Exiguobacterium sp. SH5S4]TCI43218.1 DUF975 family protein [Exiguobacterium sp. SH3S3]TCI54335.1 DUF975 family protein [Exiguobacterium sp. SH5S13]TCI58989.1 DUF975 family protein [Exiguobacterium sp. SH3S2]